jgi:hypothetical protein
MAVASGLCSSLAALSISYPTRRAVKRGEDITSVQKSFMYIGNLAMMAVSQALGIYANGLGPVSISFPFAVCASIISIFLLQWRLGMIFPVKSVRIGTYTLCFAIVILPGVGPTSPSEVNVVALLTRPVALSFIGSCVIVMILGIVGFTRGWIRGNTVSLWSFALMGGTGTVLNVSVSKMVQEPDVSWALRILFVVIYVLFAIFTVAVQAIANGQLQDPSSYVPVSCAVNLWLNFLAGLAIWDELKYVKAEIPYFSVFFLIFLGTYGLSNLDFHPGLASEELKKADADATLVQRRSTTKRLTVKAHTLKKLATQRTVAGRIDTVMHLSLAGPYNYIQDPIRTLGVDLWRAWSENPVDRDENKQLLSEYLDIAIGRSLLDARAVKELCMQLLEEQPGSRDFHTSALEQWLMNSIESFKESKFDAKDEDDGDESP